MKSIVHALIAAAVFATSVPAAFAQESKQVAPSDVSVSQGEVKKIDASSGKVTIKHGELKNLHMGAMTMVFEVADKTVLSRLKQGDTITFVADNTGGRLVARDVTIKK